MSTSDSVDRVFVHALATVRRLPRTGSSRPPPSARLRLYGLYKQSMEGDVDAILPRPTLPPPSPTTNESSQNTTTNNGDSGSKNNNGNAVHRYASRDLRTREAQAEIEKWDAWHACAGMSRTEAKRRYISTLIDTMKEHASATSESRDLVSELEFVWGQIQNQSNSAGSGSRSGSGGSGENAQRSGLMKMDSITSEQAGGLGMPLSRQRLTRNDTTDTQLRVSSPVSQRDSDDIVEGEDVGIPEDERGQTPAAVRDPEWRTSMEEHLRRLSTEIAALREQLSSNHMLSSSSYSPYTYQQLSVTWKIWYRISSWMRWSVWAAMRQASVNAVLIGLLVAWGRWKGDRRVEEWARRRWKDIRGLVRRALGGLDITDLRRMVQFRTISS